jgi:hypothetical protein
VRAMAARMASAAAEAIPAAVAVSAPCLAPQHAELLRTAANTAAVVEARGYRTVTVRAELRRLGFSHAQARVPALLVPVWTVHGEFGLFQIRQDSPRLRDGKPLKYETPRGARMVLEVPPAARYRQTNPRVQLLITEGARGGRGPVYIRVSARAVRYAVSDIDAYLAAARRTSTSDPGPMNAGDAA